MKLQPPLSPGMKKAPRPGISGAKGQCLPRYHPRWTELSRFQQGTPLIPPRCTGRARPCLLRLPALWDGCSGMFFTFPALPPFQHRRLSAKALRASYSSRHRHVRNDNRLCPGCQGGNLRQDKKSTAFSQPPLICKGFPYIIHIGCYFN